MDVELITPIAMEEKLRFAIREGGRTVGAGVVAKISGIGRPAAGFRGRGADSENRLEPRRAAVQIGAGVVAKITE